MPSLVSQAGSSSLSRQSSRGSLGSRNGAATASTGLSAVSSAAPSSASTAAVPTVCSRVLPASSPVAAVATASFSGNLRQPDWGDRGEASACPIRVVVRFRPPVTEDEEREVYPAFDVDVDGAVESADQQHRFHFDRAFGQGETQESVYSNVGRPIVEDVLEGYHGTILAYGPTGSGKTYCMFGPPHAHSSSLQGVVPRATEHIFERVAAMTAGVSGMEFTIECRFFEVYCEQLRDFLRPKNTNLQVKESPQRGFQVEGLSHKVVRTAAEALQVLRAGLKIRVAANTKLNTHSSRSHAIFSLSVRQFAQGHEQCSAKLTLVDLAGSEKVHKSGSVGENLEEAKKINSSLSSLGHVIDALADRRPHVPYRDSRLTRLLEESLGGNCRTALLVACSPSNQHISETLSSLRFAGRAKRVTNCPRINNGNSPAAIADRQLLDRIHQLRRELASAHRELEKRFTRTEPGPAGTPCPAKRGSGSPSRFSPSPPRSRNRNSGGNVLARSWTERTPALNLEAELEKVAAPRTTPLRKSSSDASLASPAVSSLRSRTTAPPLADLVGLQGSHRPPLVGGASREDQHLCDDVEDAKAVSPTFAAAMVAKIAASVDKRDGRGSHSARSTLLSTTSTAVGSGVPSSNASAAGYSASGTPVSSWRETITQEESPAGARRYSWLLEATSLTEPAASMAVAPPKLWGSQPVMPTAVATAMPSLSVTPSAPLATLKLPASDTASVSSWAGSQAESDAQGLQIKLEMERHRCAALTMELERRAQESSRLKQRLHEVEWARPLSVSARSFGRPSVAVASPAPHRASLGPGSPSRVAAVAVSPRRVSAVVMGEAVPTLHASASAGWFVAQPALQAMHPLCASRSSVPGSVSLPVASLRTPSASPVRRLKVCSLRQGSPRIARRSTMRTRSLSQPGRRFAVLSPRADLGSGALTARSCSGLASASGSVVPVAVLPPPTAYPEAATPVAFGSFTPVKATAAIQGTPSWPPPQSRLLAAAGSTSPSRDMTPGGRTEHLQRWGSFNALATM